jgi:hypothetical protein
MGRGGEHTSTALRVGGAALAGVLLGWLGLAGAGAAAAAASPTNTYSLRASIKPLRSGTPARPRPVSIRLRWAIGTSPPGQRPAEVNRYAITYEGIQANPRRFPSCPESRLAQPDATVYSCPAASRIGSGYLIFELGAPEYTIPPFIPTCSSSVAVFNGGRRGLTLFVYQGHPRPGQPTECTIPGGHAAVHVRVEQTGRGLRELFTLPRSLLHPAPGLEAAVTEGALALAVKQRTLGRGAGGRGTGGQGARRRVGLFESYLCPRFHRRRVAVTFTREDGVSRTAAAFVRCR